MLQFLEITFMWKELKKELFMKYYITYIPSHIGASIRTLVYNYRLSSDFPAY